MGDTRDRNPELHGVGGWLAFLCVSLLILTPLGLVFEIAQMVIVSGQAGMTPEIVAGIVVGVLITAFAVYTGLGLVRIWRNAVRTANFFFFINIGFGALAFAGFHARGRGDRSVRVHCRRALVLRIDRVANLSLSLRACAEHLRQEHD